MNTAANHGGIKSLQILRAVASTSVIYAHIGVRPDFGRFGADIFFVLSGFVMAMIVEHGQKPTHFAVARISHIVPMYWLLTTGVMILTAWKPNLFNSTTANFENYFKSLFFIPYYKENGLLHPMLAVGWTLNYEMFFYACVFITVQISRRFYFFWCAAALIFLYVVAHTQNIGAVATEFLGNAQVFEFLLGLATFQVRDANPMLRAPKAVSLGGIVGCYVFMAYEELNNPTGENFFIYGLPAFCMLWSFLGLETLWRNNPGPLATALISMGDASYATYLSHPFIVEGVRKIADQKLHLIDTYTPLGVVCVLVTALAVGQLLYGALDKPLSRQVRSLFSRKSEPARHTAVVKSHRF